MRSSRNPAYRPQAEDTDPEIDRLLIAAYRAMCPADKAQRVAADSRAVERLALAGIALRKPGVSAREQMFALAALRLAPAMFERAYPRTGQSTGGEVVPSPNEPVSLALHVTALLERIGVACVVGGSLASSVFGEPRATEDIDVVAALHEADIGPLLAAFSSEFYVDEIAVRRAVERCASFNVIHLPSARKVDIFVPPPDPLAQAQIARRALVTVSDASPGQLYLLTAEDTILQKLQWYKKGGEVSDRQWRDVLGVIKVQGKALDWQYLTGMADLSGLRPLLQRARTEVT